MELAAAVTERPDVEGKLRQTLSADKVRALASDGRFRVALASVKDRAEGKAVPTKLFAPSGRELGSIAVGKGVVRIALPTTRGEDFAEFLERELPGLVDQFLSTKSGDG